MTLTNELNGERDLPNGEHNLPNGERDLPNGERENTNPEKPEPVNIERTVYPWTARGDELTQQITYYRIDSDDNGAPITAEGNALIITLSPNQGVFMVKGDQFPVTPDEGFDNLSHRYIDNNGSMLKVDWDYKVMPQITDVISVSNRLDGVGIVIENPPEKPAD